ncbi:hypothetical protein RDWZM_010060 [Blomia tropicalis]|uniref:RING-type domain-containing protein n=1 Tax=Blomia tropicalis TaxID=40697 RepID=A0A9Q0RIP4_BLOTA|nr:hypothetical protein RDWZM_010060 [Blomia tropicalis]
MSNEKKSSDSHHTSNVDFRIKSEDNVSLISIVRNNKLVIKIKESKDPSTTPIVTKPQIPIKNEGKMAAVNIPHCKSTGPKVIIKFPDINDCISCVICKGYIISATKVPDCFHTFCKSCLVKHLQLSNTCPYPQCKQIVHPTTPLEHIRSDPKLQDIIYKLVPGLHESELKRQTEFYGSLPVKYDDNDNVGDGDKTETNEDIAKTVINVEESLKSMSIMTRGQKRKQDKTNKKKGKETIATSSTSANRQLATLPSTSMGNVPNSHLTSLERIIEERARVGIELMTKSESEVEQITYRYIRLSPHVTIMHIKKFLAKQLWGNQDYYTHLNILFNDEPLGRDHTLKFVFVTRYKNKRGPLRLFYQLADEYK